MPRKLLCCAALAALALPCRAEQTITPTETVIRLTVSPMPAPKPALRYLLLPELREVSPGNPIANYLKCFLMDDFSADRETLGPAALRQADRAARMDRPDWQILPQLKTEGIRLLIPDVQKLRSLAAGLKERFQNEIAQRRFDDALVTAKTMFAMSRHLGEHPTLIGNLVAIAIASITIGNLEEMLEQPGCPNLYWALTNLPTPLVSLEKGLEGERVVVLGELRDLDDRAPMSAEQLRKLIAHLDLLLKFEGNSDKKARTWVDARARDDKLVSAARRRLAEGGLPEERLREFPAEQVILLDEKREYEVRRDEAMKLMNMPFWQAAPFRPTSAKPPDEPALFDGTVPALWKVRLAQGRLEQRIGLLRHVEALRLYAAAHDGQWPEKLTDVSVPLLSDPFTNKPFDYRVEGTTAHVRGNPPPGEEKTPAYNVHYELTLRK